MKAEDSTAEYVTIGEDVLLEFGIEPEAHWKYEVDKRAYQVPARELQGIFWEIAQRKER